MKALTLNKEESVVVAIDFQERLMIAMHNREDLTRCVINFIKGARVLKLPILFTQQYTKGLGATVDIVKEAATTELFGGMVSKIDNFDYIEKIDFSAMKEPDFVQALRNTGKKQVILLGVEAHICVEQTALDLTNEGYQVFLLADCISSRSLTNQIISLERMANAGIAITTYEAVLFEILGSAKELGFKEISHIVK